MTKQTTPTSSYKEVRIGKTIYRVTSFFSGEKDLGKTLEQLAVRRAMSEAIRNGLQAVSKGAQIPDDIKQ